MSTLVFLLLTFVGSIQTAALFKFIKQKEQTLTCEQIKQFVDGHNIRRQRLANGEVPGQPAASEMKFMIWDEELAQKAGKWASKYRKRQHNPNRTLPSKRFRTGENLAWYIANFEPDVITMAMDDWFNEYKDYTFGNITREVINGPKAIAHYTQMAWSDSIYLGCAIYKYDDNEGMTNFNIVCNYGKSGNVLKHTPYESGNPARRLLCPTKEHCARPYGKC